MQAFNKTVRVGTLDTYGAVAPSLFLRIEFAGSRLSITGVEGPKRNGDAIGGCGQCRESLLDIRDFAKGWNTETAHRMLAIWNDWHLNDLQAGTPAQTAYLKANPVPSYPDHYSAACEALKAAGLNPDNGYHYGTAWLAVDVPADVLDFLRGLPDTDRTPAWV